MDADRLLALAEDELGQVEQRVVETAARLDDGPPQGRVRRVPDRLADQGHADNDTIVALCA